MRKTKKFLSLLLVVAFALSLMIPTASAAQFSDVPATYRYYDAVENLAARGIINGMGDGTFAPDAAVKRSEFAKIVCIGIVGTGDVAPTSGSGFTDVAADHWASGFIKVAAASGIINGMGDGTFAPENSVTYEQAVKMLVCALGYDAQALARGGYPNGYLTVAGSLGLLKSVIDGSVGAPANRGLIAKLVDNALNVETIDPLTGKTTGSVSDNDKTKEVEGQVVAVYGTTLEYGEVSPCGKNQIAIDTGRDIEIFSIEDLELKNADEWLGKYVVAYYEAKSGVTNIELTKLSEQRNANVETTINLNDISEYSDTVIEYMDKDENYEEADVASDAIIMLNGSPVDPDDKTLSELLDANINSSGTIRLLDAEDEGAASVVFLMVYDTIVVNSISKNDFKVYDKITSGKSVILDEDNRSKTITFTKNGSAAEFSGIATGNILSVATNEAGDKIDVLISTNTVSGTISEISDDCMTLYVNSKEYKVAKSYASEAARLFTNEASVKLYLDAFDMVAFAEISNNVSYTYAYLIGVEKEGGTSQTVSVRLYDFSTSSRLTAKTIQIDVDNGVRINGTKYTEPDDIIAEIKASADLLNVGNAAYDDAEKEQYTQVVKYSLKGIYLDKLVTYTGETDRGNANVLNVDNIEAADIAATSVSKLGKYSISGPALVIPADRTMGDYSGKSSGSYSAGYTYKVQLVDASEGNSVKAVLIYGSNASLASSDIEDSVPVIVTGVTGSTSVNNEIVNTFTVMTIGGETKKYYSKGTEEYSKLAGRGGNLWSADLEVPDGDGNFKGVAVGDVVKLIADDKGILEEIMIVTKAEDIVSGDQSAAIATAGDNGDTLQAQYRYFLGSARLASTTSGNTLVATAKYRDSATWDNDLNDESFESIADSVPVYVIDTSKSDDRKVSTGVFNDIIGANSEPDAPSKIFMYQGYNSIKCIVIYK